jgi:hypothetical protein
VLEKAAEQFVKCTVDDAGVVDVGSEEVEG